MRIELCRPPAAAADVVPPRVSANAARRPMVRGRGHRGWFAAAALLVVPCGSWADGDLPLLPLAGGTLSCNGRFEYPTGGDSLTRTITFGDSQATCTATVGFGKQPFASVEGAAFGGANIGTVVLVKAQAEYFWRVRQDEAPPPGSNGNMYPVSLHIVGAIRGPHAVGNFIQADGKAEGSFVTYRLAYAEFSGSVDEQYKVVSQLNQTYEIIKSASCNVGALRNGHDSCGAFIDPLPTLDQAAFDEMNAAKGQPSFQLSDYFHIEFSPNMGLVPEPQAWALLLAGLTGVVLHVRRRRAHPQPPSPLA